jgi:replicative DNA helicase
MSEKTFISPQNIEAEKAVLGGILLDPEALLELPSELKPDLFYMQSHGRIFQAMIDLWEHDAPIDSVSVATEMEGKISYSDLIDLQDYGMPRSIAYHASLVIAAFRQRQAINVVRETLRELQEDPQRHDEIMSRLYLTTDEGPRSGAVPIETVMLEAMKRLHQAGDARAIIPTGFSELDKQIGGIEHGELLVIAGRPSMGKTSIALDLELNTAAHGYASLFVSVETSREKLGMRMLSRETRIDSRRFRTGTLNDSDYPRLAAASAELSSLPIHMLDREADWEHIKREIRRRARYRLDLVILDYLTLLDLPVAKNDRRDLAVGRIANDAKKLAQSLNLAFILLSQLNRKSEDRNDPEPMISDIRDSGEIEQAADIIIFPFRPIAYDPDYRPRDKAFLKVAKARDLPRGTIPVRFTAEITSFSDWTE